MISISSLVISPAACGYTAASACGSSRRHCASRCPSPTCGRPARRRHFPGARGKPAPRGCAAGGRREFRPRPARIRRPPTEPACADGSNTGGMICCAVGICEITDLKREKNSVATSNSPASKRAMILPAIMPRLLEAERLDAAQFDDLDDLPLVQCGGAAQSPCGRRRRT